MEKEKKGSLPLSSLSAVCVYLSALEEIEGLAWRGNVGLAVRHV